jgi:hypothetical protein
LLDFGFCFSLSLTFFEFFKGQLSAFSQFCEHLGANYGADITKPCYVRVNTLKLDVDSALHELGKQFKVLSEISVKL